jgi:hypothetical protein
MGGRNANSDVNSCLYLCVVIGKVYDREVARQFLEVEAYRICLQFI